MVAGQSALAAIRARPRETLLRASLLLLAVTAVSKIATLAADSFVAARFGLSAEADAYLLGVGLVGALLGAPSETLRLSVAPTCGRYLRASQVRKAAGILGVLLIGTVAVGSLATLALVGGAPWIAALVAPGFASDDLHTLIQLVRVLAPTLALGCVMALLLGMLQTQLRFGPSAIVGIGLAAGILVTGVTLASTFGVTALALGYVIGMLGAVAVLAWLARDVFRHGAALREGRREVWPFLRMALPTGFALSIVSAGAVLERAFASATGVGNVAALGFAIKLMTQAGIVSQTLWTPLTPMLTASGASFERTGDLRLVSFSVRLTLLTLIPVTALIIALREPLVSVIFERGAFTADDTTRAANLLALHSGSLLGEGLFMVSVAALLSFHDANTRVIASVLFIGCKLALIVTLAPLLDVAGIALAASASSLVAGIYAVHMLSRRVRLGRTRELLAFAGSVLLAGVLALLTAVAISVLIALRFDGTIAASAVHLITGGVAGLLCYLATLKLLRVEEVETLFQRAKDWLAPPEEGALNL